MPSRIVTMQDGAPPINRIIGFDGGIVYVSQVHYERVGVPRLVVTPSGKEYPDAQVAFYLRAGEDITVGILMEALGPDWVVF